MRNQKTNKTLLLEGLKKLGISLIFMFLGPSTIYIAFSNREKPLYIPILAMGLVFCGVAILFAFRGINTIMKSLFSNK